MTPSSRGKHRPHHSSSKKSAADTRPPSGDEVRQIFGIIAAVVIVLGVAAMIFFPQLRGNGNAGLADEDEATGDLIVLAAASLTQPLNEALEVFEDADSLTTVQLSCASSNFLRRQIERGAPADVFISASAEHIATLQDRGWVDPKDVRRLWTTELVVIAPASAAQESTGSLPATLNAASRIAIGDVGVPVGEYARQALESLALADNLTGRLVPMIDEVAVIQAVANASCDRGIAYRAGVSGAVQRGEVRVLAVFPPSSHDAITYLAAVLGDAQHPERARRFLDFLTVGAGKEFFLRAGYRPLEPTSAP